MQVHVAVCEVFSHHQIFRWLFCAIKTILVTMARPDPVQYYPPQVGTWFFVHPDMRAKNPFCTIHRMVIVTWESVVEELGAPFCETAFWLKRYPFTEKVVHPCGLYDDEGMFRVILLGPFSSSEMADLQNEIHVNNIPFYEGKYLHLTMGVNTD